MVFISQRGVLLNGRSYMPVSYTHLEKAQGTAENTELQESIRLSDHYASTIKFLQGFNVELQEQKGDTSRGEKMCIRDRPCSGRCCQGS